MGQIIAIDYGKKRTGVAVTDDLQLIASGLTTVETSELISFLKNYISQNDVDGLVVGYPIDLRGNISGVEADIFSFLEQFKKEFQSIKIFRMDERFTSKIASFFISQSGKNKKQRQSKALIDKVSATIILQNFLEQRK